MHLVSLPEAFSGLLKKFPSGYPQELFFLVPLRVSWDVALGTPAGISSKDSPFDSLEFLQDLWRDFFFGFPSKRTLKIALWIFPSIFFLDCYNFFLIFFSIIPGLFLKFLPEFPPESSRDLERKSNYLAA